MTSAETMDRVLVYLRQGMSEISLRYSSTIAGCLLMSLFLSLFLVRMRKKGFYSFREDTPLKYHFFLMALLPVAALFTFVRCRGTSAVLSAAAVFAVLMAVLADILLLRWKWQGVALADLSLIMDTVILNVWIRGIVRATYAEIMNYSPAGIYSLLGVSDLWTFYAGLAAVFTAAVIIVNAAYYAKRYYLFFPGELKGVSRCAYCGRPVFPKEKYCANCGKPLPQDAGSASPKEAPASQAASSATPKEDPALQVADSAAPDAAQQSPAILSRMIKGDERYCTECGALLKDGFCRNCGRDYKKLIKDKASDAGKDIVTKTGVAALFIVFAIIPTFFSSALDLAKGSADIHNAYVEKIVEYKDDHTVARDAGWLADYMKKYGALRDKDLEWIEIPYRSLSRNNIPFYVSYAEAAYRQAGAMEAIDGEVLASAEGKGIDEEAFRSQTDLFNLTVEEMRDASYAHSKLTAGEGKLSIVFHIILDGLRYWTAKLPALLPAVSMIICGLASFVLLIRELSGKKPFLKALFDVGSYRALLPWIRGLLKGDAFSSAPDKKYVREKRLEAIVVPALVVLCFAIPALLPGLMKDDGSTELSRYMDRCREIILTSMEEQQSCANELLRYSEAISEERAEAIMLAFRTEIARDEAYLTLEDIPAGYEAFDERMDMLCRDDMGLLKEALSAIEDGRRPGQDLLVRLSGLRLREYSDLTQEYYRYMLVTTFTGLM